MRIARESGSRVSTPGCRSFFGTTVPRAMTVLRKSTSQTLTSPHSNQLHNASPARPLTRSGRAGCFLCGPPCASLGIPRLRPLGWFGSPFSDRKRLGSGARESSPCAVLARLSDQRGKPHGFRYDAVAPRQRNHEECCASFTRQIPIRSTAVVDSPGWIRSLRAATRRPCPRGAVGLTDSCVRFVRGSLILRAITLPAPRAFDNFREVGDCSPVPVSRPPWLMPPQSVPCLLVRKIK